MTKPMTTRVYEHFRLILVKSRERLGLTQAAVAKQLGKPQSYVSKYERGERRLDVVEFLEISDVLELDPAKILKQLKGYHGADHT